MTTPNNIIRKMRLRSGMTQVELAKRANVSQGWISELESQKGSLTTRTVQRIAKSCRVKVGYFPPHGWFILPKGFKVPAERR
jgi:transcriptional regulator with XRE-family HTH domain